MEFCVYITRWRQRSSKHVGLHRRSDETQTTVVIFIRMPQPESGREASCSRWQEVVFHNHSTSSYDQKQIGDVELLIISFFLIWYNKLWLDDDEMIFVVWLFERNDLNFELLIIQYMMIITFCYSLELNWLLLFSWNMNYELNGHMNWFWTWSNNCFWTSNFCMRTLGTDLWYMNWFLDLI